MSKRMEMLTLAAFALALVMGTGAVGAQTIIYDISTQSQCTEVQAYATWDGRWSEGLSTEVDHTILGGDVVAYKIQWSGGAWSGWYVTGVNDIDHKYNPTNDSLRRMWAYFYDHTHRYIICSD